MKNIITLNLLLTSLTIIQAQDTSLDWIARAAGTGFDQVFDLHIDDDDNTYTAGSFSGTMRFIDGSVTIQESSDGGLDAFALKLNAEGEIVWYTNFGGSEDDYCYGITTDSQGNIFLAGSFKGTVDFDPSENEKFSTAVGNFDMYISKFDASGNYLWTKTIGNTSVDEAKSICTDENDNIYITGRFLRTTDFDPGSGVAELSGANSTPDGFVLKLDNDGNYQWAHKIGSSSGLENGEVIVDGKDGSILVSGGFDSTVDFDPSNGTAELFGAGLSEIYFAKYDYNGNFKWVKSFQGDGYETCQDLAVDLDGNIYATGWFRDAADFDTGSGVTLFTSEGAEDSFIAKLSPQGNTIWARQIGSPNLEWSYSIAVDEIGDVYTTGFFYSTVDFDPTSGSTELTSEGIEDVFITKLNTDGSFEWAKQVGGNGSDGGYGIEIGDNGDIFVLGNHWDTADLDPETSVFNVSNNGSSDAFVIKINQTVISDIDYNEELKTNFVIAPNPSQGILHINQIGTQDLEQIDIYSAQGVLVKSQSAPRQSINLSYLPKGLYSVILYTKDGKINLPWAKI